MWYKHICRIQQRQQHFSYSPCVFQFDTCHLCTERITRDQERCPGGHPTKPEPSQILLNIKCNMMQLTRKRIKKIHASYTLEGTNLENVESIKYLGVTITSDLRWKTHVSNVCTKANRTLGFLRRNLYSCPQEVKEAAYKGLVRPVLDYGSSGPPRGSSPGRIRKRAKARCQICDR